jgi:hypothetical protein
MVFASLGRSMPVVPQAQNAEPMLESKPTSPTTVRSILTAARTSPTLAVLRMFRKPPRASTFPLGPESEPSPTPSAQEEEAPIEITREEVSPERKFQAAFRVQKMREYLSITPPASSSVSYLPSPSLGTKFEEQKRDSAIGSGPILPRLKNDFFWLSLTLILKPKLLPAPTICQICKQGICSRNPMGTAAWRLHGCGHRFHVSCLRGLEVMKTSNFCNDPNPEFSTTDPDSNDAPELCTTQCRACEILIHQMRSIGRQEISARIMRLEDNLLPWLAPLQHSRYRKTSKFYRTVEDREEEDMVVLVKGGLNARYLRNEGSKGANVEAMRHMGRE